MTSIHPVSATRSTRRAAAAAAAAGAQAQASSARASATSFQPAPRKAGTMSVKERFATLEKRFLPEKAKGVDVKFQFDLSGSDGGKWYVTIKDGKITVKKGTGPSPTATLKASAKDYKKIADGEMSKTWAFIRGKLKIEGDKDALTKWDSYFKQA